MISDSKSAKNSKPNKSDREVRTVAVIDVGTSAIRMAIAEISETAGIHTLETLSQPVSLGKDTFTKGEIGKSTIEDCVTVLRSYRHKLREYDISDPDQIRVVATSAVREARNRLAFQDRIYIATGLNIDAVDEAEVNRLTYLSIQPFVKAAPEFIDRHAVVIEVGGGSTEVLALQEDEVEFSHTYRLGSLRLRKTLETFRAPTRRMRDIMEAQIDRMVSQIQQQMPKNRNVELIALGGDIRFAVAQMQPEWTGVGLAKITVDELNEFTEDVIQSSVDDLVNQYHLSFEDAESVGPALLTYARLAAALELNHVLVSASTLRDGLLKEMGAQAGWSGELSEQIVRSALDLGRKFNFDENHARHIANLSSQLFRSLQDEHQLDARYELLLYIAALLHEIGYFISNRGYHKHTMYLIRNSELFGLGKTNLLLVSLIARYHRRASPQPTHDGFASLERDLRVAVSKLAAILRIAKSLDESRSQRINTIHVKNDGTGQLVVAIPGVDDLALEQLALRQSGAMFEEIYGLSLLLRREV